MGTRSFIESYIQKLVSEWVRELERLSSFAISQPHAAYAAFMHGFTSKWTFLVRTTTDIGSLLKPLEDTIRLKFLPALADKNAPNNREQALPAPLHACMGGIGIINPSRLSASHYTTSKNISHLAAIYLLPILSFYCFIYFPTSFIRLL